jgi:hypothetical protein
MLRVALCVRRRSHRFRGIGFQPTGIGVAPPVFDPNVAALRPPQLLKPLPECRDAGLSFRIVGNRHQYGESFDPVRLCAHGE